MARVDAFQEYQALQQIHAIVPHVSDDVVVATYRQSYDIQRTIEALLSLDDTEDVQLNEPQPTPQVNPEMQRDEAIALAMQAEEYGDERFDSATSTSNWDNELLGNVGTQMREWVSTLTNTITELPRSLSTNISYLSSNLAQYASDLGAGNLRLPSFNAAPTGHRDEDTYDADRSPLSESLLSHEHGDGVHTPRSNLDDGMVVNGPSGTSTVNVRHRATKKHA